MADFPKLNAARDWPWWRGPHRNGLASDIPLPSKLDESKNVLWKSKVPGRGHASPIVVDSKVFLLTADEKKNIHSVIAYDLQDGRLLWQAELSQGGFPAKNHAKNTEASPTLACDGERLFATVYHHDAIHLNVITMEGKPVWSKPIGRFRPSMYEYGYAPSPLLYRNDVIVSYEWDGPSAIAAFDRVTGKERWKAPRLDSISFSTPVVMSVEGRDQLLISGQNAVASYDPNDGKALWSTPSTTFATCGTMVWEKNYVFASGGYPVAETIALDAKANGKILWRNKEKCYEQSMLVHEGHLYALTDKGVMFCWRTSDGKEMWKHRLTGPVSASPVLVGNRIFWANEMGTLYVVSATPQKFELLAENQVGDESFASPAVAQDRMVLRVAKQEEGIRQEYLYAIGHAK